MNEHMDPLEAELQSLRPLDLSPQARLRIANALNVAPPTPGGTDADCMLPLPLGEGRGEGGMIRRSSQNPNPIPLPKGEGTASPPDGAAQTIPRVHLTVSPARIVRWSVPIAALVAACLFIAVLLRPATHIKPPDSPIAPEQASLTTAFDDALPSVWTYRRALERSPLAAEDLLDKHAALAPRSQSSSTPVFVRSPSALFRNGEL